MDTTAVRQTRPLNHQSQVQKDGHGLGELSSLAPLLPLPGRDGEDLQSDTTPLEGG